MKRISAAAAATILLLAVGGFAQAPQKGGGDVTGPYELVAGWPQNWCGAGFQIGSTSGIWAESPDRVIVFARGCLPVLEERGRSRADAQRVGLRPLAEGSRPPSALGSHRQHRRPQRPAGRVVGAAQQAVRPAAPRAGQSRTTRIATSGSSMTARTPSTSSRATARRWCRRSARPGCRATTRRTSHGRPTSPGCRTAPSSSATATPTRAS